jgi:hypothetical protein
MIHSFAGCVDVGVIFSACIYRLHPSIVKIALKLIGELA